VDAEPRTITVNGAELTYIEQGAGDPVLFVHGTLGDYRAWGYQMAPFSQRYRAIACSRRRHWPNAWPDDAPECSAETHASDLAELVEALGYGPVHLIGSSYGALTSLVMATKRPELVRSLVLGEPPLLPWLEGSPEGEARFAAFRTNSWNAAALDCRSGDQPAGVRRFIDGVLGSGSFDHMPAPVQAGMMDNAAVFAVELETAAAIYFSALKPADITDLRIPTLLLTGELSPRMFHDVIAVLAETLPVAERAEIPDASHAMHAGNPGAYNETVLAFLARH
jgi:non-heme chloroperoxidase